MADPHRLTHAESARTLLAAASRGVLATLARDDGYPYASVVELMPTASGDVVVLLSNLAEHTKNLKQDDRVSVVIVEDDTRGEVLALGRVTCKGRISKVDDRDSCRDEYLQLHPSAAVYADFADFAFYLIHVESARFIGGFGRMSWVERDEWTTAEPDELTEIALGVIEHMNQDHPHNLLDYAHAFSDADWATDAVMVRLDRLGFDLRVSGDDQSTEVRISFQAPKTTAEQVHEAMVRLARTARETLGRT